MKVIFLDIDGVLATRKTRYNCFDNDCVVRLEQILRKTDARIVLSSTWRKQKMGEVHLAIYNGYMRPNSDLPSQENDLLLKRLIGRTPITSGDSRGEEIDEWLNSNRHVFGVDRFIIIDDDTDMEPYMDRLVRTDTSLGLSDENVGEAIRMLEGAS